jgi:hypothetical protein
MKSEGWSLLHNVKLHIQGKPFAGHLHSFPAQACPPCSPRTKAASGAAFTGWIERILFLPSDPLPPACSARKLRICLINQPKVIPWVHGNSTVYECPVEISNQWTYVTSWVLMCVPSLTVRQNVVFKFDSINLLIVSLQCILYHIVHTDQWIWTSDKC